MTLDTLSLNRWFLRNKRDFPWRSEPTPYRVWISEIMLQQTLAIVVVDYFTRWMERFPDINTLAAASEEEVIKAWEGLGYYSRARNILKTARLIVSRYGGEFPHMAEEIGKLPGLGPYTVGAILSFAYQQRAAAVDGNVMRVLARYFAIEEEIDQPKVQKRLRALTQEILPEKEAHIAMEALIELGACVCAKKAKCDLCPIRDGCAAQKKGLVDLLPKKKKRSETVHLYRFVPLICHEGRYLVQQGQRGEIMEGLWEFPFIESPHAEMSRERVQEQIFLKWGIEAKWQSDLKELSHTFTTFKAHLFPSIWVAERLPELAFRCAHLDELGRLAFSSGHRKLLTQLFTKS